MRGATAMAAHRVLFELQAQSCMRSTKRVEGWAKDQGQGREYIVAS